LQSEVSIGHFGTRSGSRGKGKERKRTCIAPIVSISTTKRSDVDHTELPANTPHLPWNATAVSRDKTTNTVMATVT